MGSEKTAIKRVKPSAPAVWLNTHGKIAGERLDYGCGFGKDAEFFLMDKYDPFYFPEFPTKTYDTVLCTYVLNVIEDNWEITQVLEKIWTLLKPKGVAYITVRNDVKKLTGKTSKGFQRKIDLTLPVVRTTQGYKIYMMVKP